MSEIICPRCGAKGNQNCTTLSGRDHIARIRAEIAPVVPESDDIGMNS